MAKTMERGIEPLAGIELRKPDDAVGVIEWSVARGLNPVCHLGAGRSGQTACRRCDAIRAERCRAVQTGKITDR